MANHREYKPVEPRQPEPEPEMFTVQEVSKILRCDSTTIRRWIRDGVLEAVTLPHVNKRRAYRIKRKTLDKVLGQQEAV